MTENWNEVGERFTSLGKRLKEHFDNAGEQAPAERRDPLREAMDTMSRAFDAVGEAVRDPEVQDEAKRAARSLVDALAQAVDGITDEVRERLRRHDRDG